MHEGWPVLKNANGRYCYRYTSGDAWYLSVEFQPDEDICSAGIVAEGPLPVGAHTWQCWVDKWDDRTLTVTLQ